MNYISANWLINSSQQKEEKDPKLSNNDLLSTSLTESWMELSQIDRDTELDRTQKWQKPKQQDGSWFSYKGTVGKVFSGVMTGKNFVSSWINGPIDFRQHPDLLKYQAQERIANLGRMLVGRDVQAFISSIQKTFPLNVIHSFYNLENKTINDFSLEGLVQKIERESRHFNINSPICIPLTIKGKGTWDQHHIVLIFIKDQIIEYFDSKGGNSKDVFLADQNSLYEVLQFCKEKFGANQIVENHVVLQQDANNCGVFVCRQIYKRMIADELNGTISLAVPSTQELIDFRGLIIKQAFPLPNREIMDILKFQNLDETFDEILKQFLTHLSTLDHLKILSGKNDENEKKQDRESTYWDIKKYVEETIGKLPISDKLQVSEEILAIIMKLLTHEAVANLTKAVIEHAEQLYLEKNATPEQKLLLTTFANKPSLVVCKAQQRNETCRIDPDANILNLTYCYEFDVKGLEYYSENEMGEVKNCGLIKVMRTISIDYLGYIQNLNERLSTEENVDVVDWFL